MTAATCSLRTHTTSFKSCISYRTGCQKVRKAEWFFCSYNCFFYLYKGGLAILLSLGEIDVAHNVSKLPKYNTADKGDMMNLSPQDFKGGQKTRVEKDYRVINMSHTSQGWHFVF